MMFDVLLDFLSLNIHYLLPNKAWKIVIIGNDISKPVSLIYFIKSL